MRDFEARADLGEGGTPLLPLRRSSPPGVRVLLKDESRNPTGSFKARGLSLAVNRARELGAPGVQLASAGNAALALVAYAAAAGLPARVALPEDTPSPIAERCVDFGAEVLQAPGTLVEARGLLAAHDDGFWDLSTLREPYRVEGKKTMGLELAEQLGWRLPDWIIYPTGGGTGILGMARAFSQLAELGLVEGRAPRFAMVQMAGCAPLVAAFASGQETAAPWPVAQTRVWGLRVPQALGDFQILRDVRASGGAAVAVDESALAEVARRAAHQEGLSIGPEGAAAWAAMEQLVATGRIRAGQTVVLFQTGDPANYLWRPGMAG